MKKQANFRKINSKRVCFQYELFPLSQVKVTTENEKIAFYLRLFDANKKQQKELFRKNGLRFFVDMLLLPANDKRKWNELSAANGLITLAIDQFRPFKTAKNVNI